MTQWLTTAMSILATLSYECKYLAEGVGASEGSREDSIIVRRSSEGTTVFRVPEGP